MYHCVCNNMFSLSQSFLLIGPVILVLYNACPLDIGWAKTSDRVMAILEQFFPAQTAGTALANILTGKYSPAGCLPNTWPASLEQVRYIDHNETIRPQPQFTCYALIARYQLLLTIRWLIEHIATLKEFHSIRLDMDCKSTFTYWSHTSSCYELSDSCTTFRFLYFILPFHSLSIFYTTFSHSILCPVPILHSPIPTWW